MHFCRSSNVACNLKWNYLQLLCCGKNCLQETVLSCRSACVWRLFILQELPVSTCWYKCKNVHESAARSTLPVSPPTPRRWSWTWPCRRGWVSGRCRRWSTAGRCCWTSPDAPESQAASAPLKTQWKMNNLNIFSIIKTKKVFSEYFEIWIVTRDNDLVFCHRIYTDRVPLRPTPFNFKKL